MTIPEALRVLDFTDMAHAKLWLDNRTDGCVIDLRGLFMADELDAIAVLMRARHYEVSQ